MTKMLHKNNDRDEAALVGEGAANEIVDDFDVVVVGCLQLSANAAARVSRIPQRPQQNFVASNNKH